MWLNKVEPKPFGCNPQSWDVKGLQIREEANPGGQIWSPNLNGKEAPYGKYEGVTIFEAARKFPERNEVAVGYLPTEEEWRFPNIYEDTGIALPGERGKWGKGVQLPEHEAWFFYLQRLCNHCTYPACVAACPRKAIYKRPEDGIVLIDQTR